MKIGELSRLTATPVETIRYYEREGLLPPPARTSANYRHYSPAQAERLAFIRRCRSLDMALDEIRTLLRLRDQPDQDCQGVNAVLDEHIGHVARRIAELQALADQLQALRNCCTQPQEVRDCGILQGLSLPEAGALAPAPRAGGHAHLHGVHGRQSGSTSGGPALSPGPQVRAMQPDDLAAVMQIQAACYPPAMVEPLAVLRQRLQAAPGWAWVAQGGADGAAAEGALGAYLWGYPSRRGKVTPLGADFVPADEPDCLYLHDLAVSPQAQGLGLGAALIRHAWACARQAGLAQAALVSVQDSRAYWQRQGYAVVDDLPPAERQHLAGYTGPAWYMVKPLC